MKTKEEILKEAMHMIWTYQDFDALGPRVHEAMELYAAELTKEKDEKIEVLKKEYKILSDDTINFHKKANDLIESLRKENEELRELLDDAGREILHYYSQVSESARLPITEIIIERIKKRLNSSDIEKETKQ